MYLWLCTLLFCTEDESTTATVVVLYSDVIMSAMVILITGVSIVESTVCSGADKRKHQSSASLAFVRGIYRWPVIFPHKGPVTRKMFILDDVTIVAGAGAGATTTTKFTSKDFSVRIEQLSVYAYCDLQLFIISSSISYSLPVWSVTYSRVHKRTPCTVNNIWLLLYICVVGQ